MATTTTTTTRRADVMVPTRETESIPREPREYVFLAIRYLVLILVTIFLIGPFVMALLGSFKSTAEVLAWPPTFLPEQWRTQNYADVWNALADANGNSYFPRWILNSVILGTTVTVSHLFFCSLAGFAFARLNFPAKGFIFAAMLSTLKIPCMVLMIPQYQILNSMGLANTNEATRTPNIKI